MNRLFGLLIISLAMLTASIVLQIVWPIYFVIILGIVLLIPNSKSQNNEEESVTDEEIEAELRNPDYKNK